MDDSWLPESLYLGLQDLEGTVKEVGSLLNDHQNAGTGNENPLTTEAGEDILVENHASVLNGAHLIIQELQQITMACRKQGESGLAVPPLDPMLHEWIYACSANVLRIKKCIQPLEETTFGAVEEADGSGDEWLLVENDDEDRQSAGGNEIEVANSGGNKMESLQGSRPLDEADLGLEFKNLKDCTTCIAEFIPILKFQIDEFLADNVSHAQFPHSTTERRTRGSGNYSFTPAPSSRNPSLENLRRLLYELSDEIKACRSSLASLVSSPTLPVDIKADINDLVAACGVSVRILAELLSNNASEWIDSMLAGKLSFGEFSTLDQEELLEFVQDLRQMNVQLRQAVQNRAGRRAEVGDVADLQAMELGMWSQRIKGLNWMLGNKELT